VEAEADARSVGIVALSRCDRSEAIAVGRANDSAKIVCCARLKALGITAALTNNARLFACCRERARPVFADNKRNRRARGRETSSVVAQYDQVERFPLKHTTRTAWVDELRARPPLNVARLRAAGDPASLLQVVEQSWLSFNDDRHVERCRSCKLDAKLFLASE